jgi:flavin-dependent dehydrogenase
MNFDYDVVIIGGAFSGTVTALMLKRKRPRCTRSDIEKTAEFDRKVGEATTEVSEAQRGDWLLRKEKWRLVRTVRRVCSRHAAS